jgi:hypothetical protein
MTVLGAAGAYVVLTLSGMRPDDRALLVSADAALVFVISEILRERN